jgi:hypothetical protein
MRPVSYGALPSSPDATPAGPFGRVEPWNGRNEMRGAASPPAFEFSAIVIVRSCARPWRTLSHCPGTPAGMQAV